MDPKVWLDDIKEKLAAKFKDYGTITIITAVADKVELDDPSIKTMEGLDFVTISKITDYYRTEMQLDGDSRNLMSSGPRSNEVKDIHERHVDRAVINFNNMTKVTLMTFIIVASILGVPDTELKDAKELISKFGLVSK